MPPRLRTPFYYLTWRPPALSAEHEIAMARLTRRRGFAGMVLLHWAVYLPEKPYEDEYHLVGALGMLFAQHYIGIVAGLFAIIGSMVPQTGFLTPALVLASVWAVALLYGTARFLGWLAWLQQRWPGDLS